MWAPPHSTRAVFARTTRSHALPFSSVLIRSIFGILMIARKLVRRAFGPWPFRSRAREMLHTTQQQQQQVRTEPKKSIVPPRVQHGFSSDQYSRVLSPVVALADARLKKAHTRSAASSPSSLKAEVGGMIGTGGGGGLGGVGGDNGVGEGGGFGGRIGGGGVGMLADTVTVPVRSNV